MEELYYKIKHGKATEDEKKAFYNAIESSEEGKEEFLDLEKTWMAASFRDDGLSTPAQRQKSFDDFWAKVEQPAASPRHRMLFPQIARYAAAVVLLMCFGAGIYHFAGQQSPLPNTISFATNASSTAKYALNDGSVVTLNANSSIDLLQEGQDYSVTVEGEVHFDLIPNEARNLTVRFGQFTLRDIGTRFNVRVNPDQQQYEAVLFEGAIHLENAKGETVYAIAPGQKLAFDRSAGKVKVSKDVNLEETSAWLDDKFYFQERTLVEICDALQQYYNIPIVLDKTQIGDDKYSFSVSNNLAFIQIMELFAQSASIQYKLDYDAEGKIIRVTIDK
ncbi:FecR family protein [Persicobacter diffluens]|uniref:DUF4974 domain-containing protein n=1 Tax=Persicobacter diffluens TaxID=981 RepID=A0AAN4W3G0_9BACT|nr:hypothetical protein PEDI_49690 [Persicobacter diffluens]